MDVHGVGPSHNVNPYKSLRPTAPPRGGSEPRALSPRDTVEISAAAKSFDPSSATSVRAERLAQIKSSIEAGTYDTPERFEAALDRMFSQLGLWDE